MTLPPDPGSPAFAAETANGPDQTYPGAPESLISHWQKRRKRLRFGPNEGLPPLDVDLAALLATPIHLPAALPERTSLHAQKLHAIRTELAGKPELAALNAILIAHLRKEAQVNHAPALFRRIWAEAGQALMPHLPERWLISTVITFGDHGETEAQRRIGLGMNVLFSLMKLYEYERFHSGFAPDQPFPLRPTRGKRLPVGMQNFALVGGGLDINLLVQLWREAKAEPVVGPIACHLLDLLNADRDNLFRRIGLMRDAKTKSRRQVPDGS